MYMCMYMYVYAITTSHHAYCIMLLIIAGEQAMCVKV